MRKLLTFCMLLLCNAMLFAQSDDSLFISKIADEILVSGKIYENLRVLCKTVGGRLSGSPQKFKAEQWGLETLKTAGADKVYLQECKVPHWERGGKDQASYTFKDNTGKAVKETLDVLALGNSMGTGKNGITAPVVYCKNFDDLEKQKDNVRGKIVFFNNAFNEKYVTPFLAYGESGIYRRLGPARAAKYGAVAVVIRSLTGSANDNNPHTGLTQYDSNYTKIPCAAMGVRDADKLAAFLQEGKAVQLYYQSNARMLPDTIGHNVIGELTGSSPNEIITIGGHLDSWDPAEGAQDDGAGCVHSIEVLRALKTLGYKPKHTIRIVLFADEENGGNGGEMYANTAKTNGEQHLFAFESDAGGYTPRGMGFSMSAPQLAKAQAWVPLLLPYGVYQFTMGGGGSDIGPLHLILKTPVAGLVPDNNRYFDLHHARNDVFENVNRRELELGAVNMTALIYLIDKYGL